MIRLLTYLVICSLIFSSCKSKRLNERVSLWRNDKIPYGTNYAFSNLVHLFPYSDISINKVSPVKRAMGYHAPQGRDSLGPNEHSAFIVITPSFKPDDSELSELLKYVTSGNHLFISTFEPGQALLDSLKITLGRGSALYNFGDSLQLELEGDKDTRFVYPGKKLDNYIESFDSSITNIIGYDGEGHPDFIKFNFKGEGSLVLHLAPLAFSNFFLLHRNNSSYYDQSLSLVPNDIGKVYWDDYYRYYEYGKKKGAPPGKNVFSRLGVIMKDEILRWALFLAMILFALVYLFESKRKQRMMPIVPPVKNASLDFIQTIGRLYFQQRDHNDLAKKMSIHFIDHLRTKYRLAVSMQEQELAARIAVKTAYDQQKLADIISIFQLAIAGAAIEDEQLMELYQKTEEFYNHI